MPSTSKSQQRFMGLVHAYKKGEVPASKVSKAVKDAAKSMKKSSTKKYASTKHTDLPDKVKEERDYKEEYKKYSSSTKSKKYRAELNQYNRKKGTYGNGDGKDASHKGGKIVGFESQSKNRGRAEKSRLKKEAVNEDGHTDVASVERKLKLIIKDSVDTIKKLRSMSNEDSLPSWWTDKITLAKDYVSKSRDYIMNPAEDVDEGFGGQLKGRDKQKFEKARKSNGEQLGYTLTGTKDIKESVNEIFPKGAGRKISKAMQKGYTVYTTDKKGKKVKKIKSYGSRQAAAVAMGKLMKNLDTDYFPKNVDGLMYIKESVNEKMGPKELHAYMQHVFDTQFKTADEKKMKKILIKKMNIAQKKKGLPIFKESVNEKTVSIGGEELMKYLMKRFKMSKSKAIASMKKHKMDMSFLKKESVNEAVEPAGNMAKIQKIVKDSQATKLGGVMVDMQSASLLMKLYDKVSDKDKERMNKFPAKKLTLVIKRLWDRINLKLPL
jgi:hypothetical protein